MIKNIVIKISHISNFYTNNDTKTEKNSMRTIYEPNFTTV